ncbi:MAG: transposase, partial [Candidatus Electrothrix sp. AR4]|nr:transposase [Candidatus Electrothrix sp. AR4]
MPPTLDQIKQNIPDSERQTPSVTILLELLEQHLETVALQKEQIQQLKDEIARLKKQKPKPKISPSNLSKKGKKKRRGKRPGSAKKKKTANLEIHETERIKPESIPPGSTFNGCKPYTVQGLQISVHNTRYLLEQWETPDGKIISGQLPSEIDGHFDNTLRTFILHQYHHCHVTQPLLLEQLREWRVDISSGQLNNILTKNKDSFYDEKDAILSAGLRSSSYVNVDDTGARHNGKNGYCTHIGNDFFAWFESTESKSRINFLSLLRAGAADYILNEDAFEYMEQKRLPKSSFALLLNHPVKKIMDTEQWKQHLKKLGIVKPRHIQIATEGALFGCVLSQLPRSLVIVSDDAG